ncbi:MAG: DUF357 domain-containing protein [Candidatus Aenigmarchaeota archaeon]|nr:DUF357 domain-containing protein [Candidatus Aenigmarchaeota archaeon]
MSKDYENELAEQTKIWSDKIKTEMQGIKLLNRDKRTFLENVQAYIQDSEYFVEQGDLVRAFEAIIWAWSWLEIGKEEKILG